MTTSPFMSLKEAARFFCVSDTTIRNSPGEYAKLAHVKVNGRHFITRASAEKLAAEILKRAQCVTDIIDEIAERRRA